MRCDYCGQKNERDALMCWACGAPMPDDNSFKPLPGQPSPRQTKYYLSGDMREPLFIAVEPGGKTLQNWRV